MPEIMISKEDMKDIIEMRLNGEITSTTAKELIWFAWLKGKILCKKD